MTFAFQSFRILGKAGWMRILPTTAVNFGNLVEPDADGRPVLPGAGDRPVTFDAAETAEF